MKKMIKIKIVTAAVIFILTQTAAFAQSPFAPQDPILPLSGLTPGAKGYARTVMSGKDITPFEVTILGVVPRKNSPKNLILIRVEDKRVRENGGIAAGMSGSPVYVDGRLIGAIGYGWSFADRNLGLVTPIEEMIKAMNWAEDVPDFKIPVPRDAQKSADKEETSADKTEAASGDATEQSVAETSSDREETSNDAVLISGDGVEMSLDEEPSARTIPLAVDGVSARFAEELEKKLGVRVVPLGVKNEATGSVNLKWSPKPGAAIGAALAWGDYTLAGIGTLTAVAKDGRFLAFAHPMFNRGAVAYALTEAEIVKIIPSLESSFKLGSIGDITGIVTQDRPEAIGGAVGKLAAASGYTINFHDVDAGVRRTKRFQTVADPYIGPEIASVGILGIIDDLWARKGAGTAMLSYTVSGGNMTPAFTRRNIFYSDSDVVTALQQEIEELGKAVALNPFREIKPYGVTIDVETSRAPRLAYIEKIEIPNEKKIYAPGDKMRVDMTLRPWRKAPVVKSFELTVPEDAMAYCEITARGGGIEEPLQEPLITGTRTFANFKEWIKELEVKETNNQVILEISGPEKDGAKKKKSDTKTSDGKKNYAPGSDGAKDDPDDKKPSAGRGAEQKEDDKEAFTPADLMEERFVSEIRNERVKEGAMVIADTNYYVEGVIRKFIRIKSDGAKEEDNEDEIEKIIAEAKAEAEKETEEEEKTTDEEELSGVAKETPAHIAPLLRRR